MGPLKRFIQCGSLTMLLTLFVVLFGVTSTALTTFGKTNQNTYPPTPAPQKGRECNNHMECAAIAETSCVKDPNDGKTRCLCGDNNAPINGHCESHRKGLRHLCSRDSDCDQGMICGVDNSTRSTSSMSRNMNSQHTKMCLCDEENGWEESVRDMACNRAVQTLNNYLMPLSCLLMSIVLSQRYNINFKLDLI